MSAPRQYPGVMVSSTFADLREHRAALMSAIQGQHLHAVAMESDSARPMTVIESSLEKVRDAAAYIGIISRRYGAVPECSANPDGLSLTHLEFREAVRLGRPILVFIMGAGHLVTEDDIELDPDKRAKLAKFREEAMFAGGDVHQVYKEFNDLASFATAATQSVAELRRMLDAPAPAPSSESEDHIPAAPALYARPRYLGSHDFVGREAQLATLSDWARPAGQHSVLLFEAIGGSGKSILTWEWTNRHALGVRGDWAGRFWYSFYEAGAVMSDFCRRALSYMTGKPLKAFVTKQQRELTELLVHQLESRPWLLVLDGLERVLVAYHRFDAAQVLDEDAGSSDEIAHRDPTAAIRPDDDDLLRRLAAVSPSRILITSRLVPRALLNQSSQAIPGVVHERLPGLRPVDAEALMRASGVTGESSAMRSFLQRHCDCHPLVTGIVAGLVNDYLPARGDFDSWSADLEHGRSLEVGDLDLVQKRNHILHRAVEALPDASRQLLSTVALLSAEVDYETLRALSPHVGSAAEARDLTGTVSDLERRGLLQYDRQARQYDLHPVVRAVVMAELGAGDRERLGGRVVDYFSTRRTRYEAVKDMEDLRDDMTLVRTLLRMGRLTAAAGVYFGGLSGVLFDQFEAGPEMLSLLRPFFGTTWSSPSAEVPVQVAARLINYAAAALTWCGDIDQAVAAYEVGLRLGIQAEGSASAVNAVTSLSLVLRDLNRLAASRRAAAIAIELAELIKDPRHIYRANLELFWWHVVSGRSQEAEHIWRSLSAVHPHSDFPELVCEGAMDHATFLFEQGLLTDEELARVEADGRRIQYRYTVRGVHLLRGKWLAQQREWAGAVGELREAVRLAREVGLTDTRADTRAETKLAVAEFHLGQLPAPAETAARLSAERQPDHQGLAELWHAIGDIENARKHALAAYRWAWADGEPFVRGFDLVRARKLIEELGIEVPVLAPYDPANDPELPWEAEVRAYMETLR